MSKDSFFRIFFLLKVMRLANGLKVFNVPNIMQAIKKFLENRMDKKVQNNPDIDNDLMNDYNSFYILLIINYSLQTLKLLIMIFNTSYFTGIIWVMFCDFLEMINQKRGDHIVHDPSDLAYEEDVSFLSHYKFYEDSHFKQMIKGQYYAFTSLSTVGFGDFHPKANYERIFCSIILLFGVMIFSYCIGVFI